MIWRKRILELLRVPERLPCPSSSSSLASSQPVSHRARRDQRVTKSLSSTASTRKEADKSLSPAQAGTAPEARAYLVLHTSSPAATWPSHPPLHSSFTRELLTRLKPYRATVNIAHDSRLESTSTSTLAQYAFPSSNGIGADSAEVYPATLYRASGFPLVEFPELSLDTIDTVTPYLAETKGAPPGFDTLNQQRHLYVCTHNARDCRCGTVGLEVFRSLSQHVASLSTPSVKVREIGHVGAHKFAANVLDYPSGDWYGSVSPSNIAHFARALLGARGPLGINDEGRRTEDRKLLWSLWRGRMGMSQVEQEAMHAEQLARLVDGEQAEIVQADLTPARRGSALTIPLVFETHEGERITIAAEGRTVMEVAKDSDVPSIEGTCGGKLECATCHVYLGGPDMTPLPASIPPTSEGEEDMLEYALFRTDASRLSCQLRVTKELGEWCAKGGVIKLPKY